MDQKQQQALAEIQKKEIERMDEIRKREQERILEVSSSFCTALESHPSLLGHRMILIHMMYVRLCKKRINKTKSANRFVNDANRFIIDAKCI